MQMLLACAPLGGEFAGVFPPILLKK